MEALMKIGIITMWYNEEFLAPFFLEHYRYVDKIHLLYDVDSFDRTKEIASTSPNVEIERFKFPNMMDDIIKQRKINKVLNSDTFKDFDWVYCVDADELIWPPDGQDTPLFLEKYNQYNVIYAAMWQVYRHASEQDLDVRIQPVHLQRRHGDPERFNGFNAFYYKPCIIKPGFKIKLGLGNHKTKWNLRINAAPERFDGAHWMMADVGMAIRRRIRDRKYRFSRINRLLRLSDQHKRITEEDIRNECDAHLHDPQVF
jgi:hypothetical protein